jgi:hypothetical protein
MAVLTNSGRVAMASALKAGTLHLAWGSGDIAWDNTFVPESITQTELVAEVGRRLATSIQYAVPDVNGDIIVPIFNDPESITEVRKYTVSAVPTAYLYMRFNFDYADAPSSVIREVGVFSECTTNPALPEGQKYFVPADIVEPGLLVSVQNLAHSLTRSADSRQSFEFVLEI